MNLSPTNYLRSFTGPNEHLFLLIKNFLLLRILIHTPLFHEVHSDLKYDVSAKIMVLFEFLVLSVFLQRGRM